MTEWNKLQDNVSSLGETFFLMVLSWSQPYEYDNKIQ